MRIKNFKVERVISVAPRASCIVLKLSTVSQMQADDAPLLGKHGTSL